jgi:SAM-dependent methyltransferase
MDTLRGYSGWGGCADAFSDKPEWRTIRDAIEQALTPEEYAQARASTLTAYYTPGPVVKAMWDALDIGPTPIQVLEPGCGTGNFMAGIPDDVAAHVSGVELDPISARIAAALNPAVGEDVLDALATPKYTAAQMTAIAKIAIRGGDFARFLDPQMDARRMEAAYLVVAHGGSDLPVERLSRSQLLTINNILLQGLLPYETVRAIAKPAFTPESMEVIAAAMENARHDPYTGEHSLTEAQVARIMNPEYRPEQQIALLAAMRGQTPVADLSDADFAGLFPASLSVEQMSACAYAVNRCGYNAPLLMMTMQACADMNAQQLMAVFDATAAEFSDATMAKVSTILMHTPALTSQQMRYLLAEARDGTPFPALESMKDYLLAQVEPEKAQVAETGVKSESRDMASGKEALAEQTGLDSTQKINQNKEME